MAATITLEVNDKTAEGFASFIRNLEAGERETGQFTETTSELARAVNVLSEQQAQQIMLAREQTVAIRQNRDSFVEWSNELVEFTRNVKNAASATGEWLGDKAQWVAAKTGVDLTTAALSSLAARALRVGGPLLGAKIAAEGLGLAFENTGEKIVAMEGPSSAAARRLAAEINSKLSTVEEVLERTGKTMEELGLRVESNADRIGESFGELKTTAGTASRELWDAFMAPLPIVKQTYEAAVEEMESKFAEFTRNTIENANAVTDAINEMRGLDADHVRSQKEFFANEERLKEVRAEYRGFEADLQRTADRRRELGEISRIATREELEAVRQSERTKRDELLATDQWTDAARDRHFARLEALTERELALETEKRQAILQGTRQMHENARKLEEESFNFRKRLDEEESARRQKFLEEEYAFREEIHKILGEDDAKFANRNIELMKSRIEREKVDERAKINAIAQLEQQAIMNRSAAEVSATADRIEQARIAARAIAEIQDVELRRKIEIERETARIEKEAREKSLAEAREKFMQEVELLQQKLTEEKRLREGGPSQSEFQRIAGSFGADQVREEIVANRLQGGARAGRDGQGRKLTEAEIRRMVIREMRSGQIDQKEVQAAQVDLVQQTAVQGAKTGKLSKSTAQALHSAATNIEQQNGELDRHEQEIQRINEFLRLQTDGAQRRQSQRRGSRR